MAGHPLRPATRRRLGRPLPHQQADRPRVHPKPQKLSTTTTCVERSYPVLDPVSQAYPEVQGRSPTCYSPVRRSCTPEGALPLDLHVLSTPPAFVLSQDQTLHKGPNTHPHKGKQANLENNPDQPPHRVANQRNPTHANPPHQKGEGHRVTGPKQTWLEENQTRAVEFSRNNHTTRTSPENPKGFPTALPKKVRLRFRSVVPSH